MSDSREQERPWSFYVQDMLEFAEAVLGYTSGLDMTAIPSLIPQLRMILEDDERPEVSA